MSRYERSALRAAIAAAVVALAPAGTRAAAPAPVEISLEDLLKTDVQTASRKSQRLQDVAAAAFVITREDIERSGATSIPDALRMAPGVHVARMSNNRWAVTARGLNGRFANKLLVLMDGRSIYSPLFAGVMWETEDTLLEDIERIEVIRGPNAALWGANAVNGVINIITRKARDTQDALVVAGAGSELRAFGAVRQGFALGGGHARVWARGLSSGRSVDLAGRAGNDDWRRWQLGFRGDWTFSSGDRLMVSGAASSGTLGDRWDVPDLLSRTGATVTDASQKNDRAHLLVRHEWASPDGADTALQGYFTTERMEIPGYVDEHRQTFDIDFQRRAAATGAHDVVWGLGYRESPDRIRLSGWLGADPERRTFRLASVFLNDEITLVPQALRMVVGARFEHNSITGFEPQPNLRVMWTPSAQQSIWGALSRAIRTPSRAEPDATVDLAAIPASPPVPPVLLRNVPPADHRLRAETVQAAEIGYRHQLEPNLSVDVAAFHNRYDHLRAGLTGARSLEFLPVPHIVQTMSPSSTMGGNTQGIELALDWQPAHWWRVQSSYTYFRARLHAVEDPVAQAAQRENEGSAPSHQLSLRSSMSFGGRFQFDAWLRSVSALHGDPSKVGIDAYTTLDLRGAWRVRKGLELSLVGQNLLQRGHAEFRPDQIPSQILQVQRSVYAKLKWQF